MLETICSRSKNWDYFWPHRYPTQIKNSIHSCTICCDSTVVIDFNLMRKFHSENCFCSKEWNDVLLILFFFLSLTIRMVQLTFIVHHHHGFMSVSSYISFHVVIIVFSFETFEFMNLQHNYHWFHPSRNCLWGIFRWWLLNQYKTGFLISMIH